MADTPPWALRDKSDHCFHRFHDLKSCFPIGFCSRLCLHWLWSPYRHPVGFSAAKKWVCLVLLWQGISCENVRHICHINHPPWTIHLDHPHWPSTLMSPTIHLATPHQNQAAKPSPGGSAPQVVKSTSKSRETTTCMPGRALWDTSIRLLFFSVGRVIYSAFLV